MNTPNNAESTQDNALLRDQQDMIDNLFTKELNEIATEEFIENMAIKNDKNIKITIIAKRKKNLILFFLKIELNLSRKLFVLSKF